MDSRAATNFLDINFVHTQGIPIQPLVPSVKLLAIDGSSTLCGLVSSKSNHLIISVINHFEQIFFFIINCPYTPVIVGLPWLQKHNPQVDWVTSKILQLGKGWEVLFPKPSPFLATTSVEGLPSCYSSFLDIVSKISAEIRLSLCLCY